MQEFPEPLTPMSHVTGFTLQESRVGTVLFWPGVAYLIHQTILKYNLAGALPLLFGFDG